MSKAVTWRREIVRVPISSIHALEETQECRDIDEIPPEKWRRRAAIIKNLEPQRTRQRLTRAGLVRSARKHQMGLRQLQRIREIYAKNSRVSAIARKPGGRPRGLSLLDLKVDQVIRHAIEKHFCKREDGSKAHLVLRAQSLALKLKPLSGNLCSSA